MKPDHKGTLNFARFVTFGKVKKGSIFRMSSGELDVRTYNHIVSVLTLKWMLEELKLKLKVITGPVVMIEDKKQEMTVGVGDLVFSGVLKKWLEPAVNSKWIELVNSGDELKIRGYEITIKSLEAVLTGDCLFGHEERVWPGRVSEEKKKVWLKKWDC